jgi:indolepyruvate ferredoxin oxidoreductase alpha subunit
MGGGITMFEGFAKALGRNVVGVVGDSTFVHSGITGLIDAVYNKAKGVIIILDNATTAMTGSQPHPATGITARGESTKRLVIEDVCRACGADFVDVADPFDTALLSGLLKQRLDQDALSVIIARSPCKLLDKSKSSAPVLDKSKCKKCYMCLSVNCPAITKTADGFVCVDEKMCTGCNVCVSYCKFGALVKK